MFFKRWSFLKIVVAIFVLLGFSGDIAICLPILSFEKFVVYNENNEVVCAYDYRDLNYENHYFSKQKWTALPVFFNRKYQNECFEKNERVTKAKSYAESLGFSAEKGKIIYNDEWKTELKYDSNKIIIHNDGSLEIQFDPPVLIPTNFIFSRWNIDLKKAQKTFPYLKEKYDAIIGQTTPGNNYHIWYRQQDGVRGTLFEFFEKGSSDMEKLINFQFNKSTFYPDTKNRLVFFSKRSPECLEYIGKYPIISSEQAQAMLIDGKYFSITSLHKFEGPVSIKEEMIKDVVITYWPFQESDAFIMPFYRFCVEFPQYKQDNGLNRYSYFYVLAIKPEYISDNSIWWNEF